MLYKHVIYRSEGRTRENIPMRHEDLPPVQDLLKRDGAVLAPGMHGGNVIDEDYKVVMLASVVDLGGRAGSARHCV